MLFECVSVLRVHIVLRTLVNYYVLIYLRFRSLYKFVCACECKLELQNYVTPNCEANDARDLHIESTDPSAVKSRQHSSQQSRTLITIVIRINDSIFIRTHSLHFVILLDSSRHFLYLSHSQRPPNESHEHCVLSLFSFIFFFIFAKQGWEQPLWWTRTEQWELSVADL